ncbi:hypothetical protein KCU92_g134, partial [Aureobasidium melanogenum]
MVVGRLHVSRISRMGNMPWEDMTTVLTSGDSHNTWNNERTCLEQYWSPSPSRQSLLQVVRTDRPRLPRLQAMSDLIALS